MPKNPIPQKWKIDLMLSLFLSLSKAYFKKYPFKVLISIFGVALGVAVFIAVRTASFSSKISMKNLLNSISPKAQIYVSQQPKGLPESLFPKIAQTPGVLTASSMTYTKTRIQSNQTLSPVLVLGIDLIKHTSISSELSSSLSSSPSQQKSYSPISFFSQPNHIIVPKQFLQKFDLKLNQSITLITAKGKQPFLIAAILPDSHPISDQYPPIIIMDFFNSQYFFNKLNTIDRVNIIQDQNFQTSTVIQNLKKSLNHSVSVKTSKQQVSLTHKIYQSFQLNLTVVSLISLLVGMYLIFNTINTSILQQKKQIAILRSLGMTKSNILALFSFKGLAIGFIGSATGLLFGYFLAFISLSAFSQQQGQYIPSIHFSPALFVTGFFLGISVSLVSSIIPSLSTLKITPAMAIQSHKISPIPPSKSKFYLILSSILLALATITSQFPPVFNTPIFGFLSNFLIILGFSSLIPPLLTSFIQSTRHFFISYSKIQFSFALFQLQQNIGRNSISISTLMISTSLIISTSTLINSYHHSINQWFQSVNNADFTIISGSNYFEGDNFLMPQTLAQNLKKIPQIQDVNSYRFATTKFQNHTLYIQAFDIPTAQKYVNFSFIQGQKNTAFQKLQSQNAVIISQSISQKFLLNLNDSITLQTPNSLQPFQIAGIIPDYLSSEGTVTLSRHLFQKYWNDSQVDVFKVYTQKNTPFDPIPFKSQIQTQLPQNYHFIISSSLEFKQQILNSINQTFTLFHALELTTIIIAFLSVINTFFASILEQKNDIATLKSIGASKSQISQIYLSQALIIALASSFLAFISGFFLSIVTVFVINQQTIGWYLEFDFPLLLLVQVPIITCILASLAAYYPAKKAASTHVSQLLLQE